MISVTGSDARMLLIGLKPCFDGRSLGRFSVAAPAIFKVITGMLLLATNLFAIELPAREG